MRQIDRIFKDQQKEYIQHLINYPYDLGWTAIPNDNWDVLAVDDKKEYLLIGMDDIRDSIESGDEFIHETPVDFNTKRTSMWGIPVIHTTENPVKKKM